MKPVLLLALVLGGCLDPGEPGNLVPRTVVEDPSLPRIEIAGALLHAEAFGPPDAPLVIVLHGGPGNDYRCLLPLRALADDGYRVVFWDQRGAGLSQRQDADTYTLDRYLEDLRLVIDHHTVAPDQPFVFIGQSWGAMYATWFIDTDGDVGGRLRGAVLTEPGAFTKAQLDDFLAHVKDEIALTSEVVNDALWARQFMSADDHARADYLMGMLAFDGLPSEHVDPDNPRPFWRVGAVVGKRLPELAEGGFDWTTHLGAFTHPVLFLRGDKNSIATLAHQQALAASYPDARIVTIPDVGHEVIWERPDAYLAEVRAYFDAIGFAAVTP